MKHPGLSILTTVLVLAGAANAFSGEAPPYVRLHGEAKVWFSKIGGDLIQPDQTKLGLTENLGINSEKVVWDMSCGLRLDNVHVLRFHGEVGTSFTISPERLVFQDLERPGHVRSRLLYDASVPAREPDQRGGGGSGKPGEQREGR